MYICDSSTIVKISIKNIVYIMEGKCKMTSVYFPSFSLNLILMLAMAVLAILSFVTIFRLNSSSEAIERANYRVLKRKIDHDRRRIANVNE